MTLDLKSAVSPAKLASSLKRDLKNAKYVAEIEQSRTDMLEGRMRPWEQVLDGTEAAHGKV